MIDNKDRVNQYSDKHGHNNKNSRIYVIWQNMRKRCLDKENSQYVNYGARGISICKEWDSFSSFLDWALSSNYNNKLTLDRIDCDGSYSPDNCRFVDVSTNNANKRISSKNKTGYIGVHKDRHGMYESYVNWRRNKHYLGRYHSAEDAAIARDNYVISKGYPHRLNFA